jgi:chromosome partitioning protein
MFAVNFAEYCIQHKKVLFVDLDGQGNSSSYFLNTKTEKNQGTSLLFSGNSPEIINVKDNLYILQADKQLNDIEGLPLDRVLVFKKTFQEIAKDFELVVIDTPPSQGRRLIAALASSNAVVTPLGLDRASFEGLTDLLNEIKFIKQKMNPGLQHIGILVNRYKSVNKTQQKNLKQLKNLLGDRVLSTVLNDRSSVGAAFDVGLPIWKKVNGASARKASNEFIAACDLVFRRLML